MTPRTARVQVYATVTHGINLLNKFCEAQQKNWEVPAKIKVSALLYLKRESNCQHLPYPC